MYRQRVFLTDKKKKNASETPSHFTLDIYSLKSYIKRVKGLRFCNLTITWTPTATTMTEGFIYIKDLSHDERHISGAPYHAYFPITQGSVGVSTLFRFQFTDTYITDLFARDYVNQLDITILRQNSSGELVEFTDITTCDIEVEFLSFDRPVDGQ